MVQAWWVVLALSSAAADGSPGTSSDSGTQAQVEAGRWATPAAPADASGSPPAPDRDDAVDAPESLTVQPDLDAPLSVFQREGGGLTRHTALAGVPTILLWVLPGSTVAMVAGVASLAMSSCPATMPLAVLAPLAGVVVMVPGSGCLPPASSLVATLLMQWRGETRGPCLQPVLGSCVATPALSLLTLVPPLVGSTVLAGLGALAVGGLLQRWAEGRNTTTQQTGLLVAYLLALAAHPLAAPVWMAASGAVGALGVGAVAAVLYRWLGRPRSPGEGWALDPVSVGPPPTVDEEGRAPQGATTGEPP